VTLLETSADFSVTKHDWPSFLRGKPTDGMPVSRLLAEGVNIRNGISVSEVPLDLKLRILSMRRKYDSIVVTTGSELSPVAFPGMTKVGVHLLDSLLAYETLNESRSHCSNFVVVGGGLAALDVSDELACSGSPVHLYVSRLFSGSRALIGQKRSL
jgi:NADPH-dependent 2,4-dienoyl-CoA reductase/sulfur reductase-like enzyme